MKVRTTWFSNSRQRNRINNDIKTEEAAAIMSLDAADHIYRLRVAKRSIKNYESKVKTIKSYIIHEGISPNEQSITIPLDLSTVKRLFGWLSTNTSLPKRKVGREVRLDTSILAADEFAEESITISASNMQGYKSALLWYYKENGIVMDPSTNDWIDTFVKGYKKVVADKKSRGVMKLQEGKSALSFQGFNIMCETICSLTPTGRKFTYQELLFGWAYSTICWNTMGRSHSVAGIMFHHITLKDDCLVITFPKIKFHQTGEGLSNDKHVYANPYKPAVCPI